jgi:hypothetical protein
MGLRLPDAWLTAASKSTISIEAENVDDIVRDILERFGIERRPPAKPPLRRLEDCPPATNIAPLLRRYRSR